jgi:hypothetical protein
MSISFFADKNHSPSEEEIRAALGAADEHWQRLVDFIAAQYQIPPDLNFGGKNYGWNLWYRKSGKSLVSLFPQQDGFVAQVTLGKDQVEKAFALDLGENVSCVLRETPQLHDGRWLFILVKTGRDVQDVEQLLLVKRKPLRLHKP